MLEKVEIVDKIEVLENGVIQVRVKTAIKEDGLQISGTFQRHVIMPGDDYSQEDSRVKAICGVTHTQSVVDAYKAMLDNAGI